MSRPFFCVGVTSHRNLRLAPDLLHLCHAGFSARCSGRWRALTRAAYLRSIRYVRCTTQASPPDLARVASGLTRDRKTCSTSAVLTTVQARKKTANTAKISGIDCPYQTIAGMKAARHTDDKTVNWIMPRR